MGSNHRGEYPADWKRMAEHVKAQAGWRCVRCGHRHESPKERLDCDERCDLHRHPEWAYLSGGAARVLGDTKTVRGNYVLVSRQRQRVLTVAHLDDDKSNCRWWNLVALCQVCHLQTQGRIEMHRPWVWEHSEWMMPYVAGFYAHKYLDLDLTREQVEARIDKLLRLEQIAVLGEGEA